MADQLQALITFFLYIAFFGWIGLRRGMLRELIVFLVSVIGWVGLQRFGPILIRITNFGGKFLYFVQAGGLGMDDAEAFRILGSAPNIVPAHNQQVFIFLIWSLLLILAYVISSTRIGDAKSKGNLRALFLGIANGLTYASILLPKLAQLISPAPDGDTVAAAEIVDALRDSAGLLGGGVGTLWNVFEAQRALILLFLLTILLLTAASSLTRSRAKS